MVRREIQIVAGEPSGDAHAAHLVAELAARDHGLSFRGLGGPALAAAGMDLTHDLASDAIMGIFPVIRALPRIRRWFRQAAGDLKTRRPAALILVDYPGFNMRLAARAHALGIPVIYYISPQVWAWARWRIRRLAATVDLMLVILPFEQEVFAGSGLRTVFTGHPLMDRLRRDPPDAAEIDRIRAAPGDPLVGIFPGSRRHVVQSLLPTFLETARRLRTMRGTEAAGFVVALAQQRFADLVPPDARAELELAVEIGKSAEVMRAADLCLSASGTTTLELAAAKTPFVIGYRVSPVLYGLGRLVVKVPHIGLVNLVAGSRIVPEHVGVRSFAQAAAVDLHRLWSDREAYKSEQAALHAVANSLETEDAYAAAAEAVIAFLAER